MPLSVPTIDTAAMFGPPPLRDVQDAYPRRKGAPKHLGSRMSSHAATFAEISYQPKHMQKKTDLVDDTITSRFKNRLKATADTLRAHTPRWAAAAGALAVATVIAVSAFASETATADRDPEVLDECEPHMDSSFGQERAINIRPERLPDVTDSLRAAILRLQKERIGDTPIPPGDTTAYDVLCKNEGQIVISNEGEMITTYLNGLPGEGGASFDMSSGNIAFHSPDTLRYDGYDATPWEE